MSSQIHRNYKPSQPVLVILRLTMSDLSLGSKRRHPDDAREFVSSGMLWNADNGNKQQTSDASSSAPSPSGPSGLASKRPTFFDLRTGKPYEVAPEEQFGSCRFVSEFEKLNRIGEGPGFEAFIEDRMI